MTRHQNIMTDSLRTFKHRVVERMTASHLAGPRLSDALRVCQQAVNLGWSCTVGYWTGPDDTPKTVSQAYADAVRLVTEKRLDCYVSIKVTALQYDYGLLSELLAEANDHGLRIHCDAMDPDSASRTYDLIERALAKYSNLGCTLPGRWTRSVTDAVRVAQWGIPVRVVKGQWPDPQRPKYSARAGYLEVVRALSGKAGLVAVATHDRRLARNGLSLLTAGGTRCEMEQLSSLPHNCATLAEQHHVPFRVYVPFGFPGMPYDIWQAAVRPQIVSWVIRDALRGRHPRLPSHRVA